ncbi:MAG: hypothetical protein PHR35_14285 [Kiritimatiellae bacterium]|nr:hypothetical protein [Kiritimatiellia bacterium]
MRIVPHMLPLLLALACGTASAAEILAARFYTEPRQPFVNQIVTLHLEIETTHGCQLQDLSISGLPGDTHLSLGTLTALPVQSRTQDGATIAVHHYRSTGRGLAPMQTMLSPELTVKLVERHTMGFFSSWTTVPRALRLTQTPFTIRPLPETGKPEGFAGAVGQFTLRGSVTPEVVMPQDLVTMTLNVNGTGFLGEASPLLPALPPDTFKCYPAAEDRLAAENRLTISQVVIPLSTQAVHIGAVRFPYFDPEAGTYRTATAGPFALSFTLRRSEEPTVRRLPAPDERRGAGSATVFDLEESRKRELRRLLPYAAGLLAALLGAAALRPYRPRWAWAAGLLLCVSVTTGGNVWMRKHATATSVMRVAAVLRVAPGVAARGEMEIPADTVVQPLEEAPEWVRIEVHGRRGWVPRAALSRPRTTP